MPAKRGRHLIDGSPDGTYNGSVTPLAATFSQANAKGGRVPAVSGVVDISTVKPTTMPDGTDSQPSHFAIPASVLQRIASQRTMTSLSPVGLPAPPSAHARGDGSDVPETVSAAMQSSEALLLRHRKEQQPAEPSAGDGCGISIPAGSSRTKERRPLIHSRRWSAKSTLPSNGVYQPEGGKGDDEEDPSGGPSTSFANGGDVIYFGDPPATTPTVSSSEASSWSEEDEATGHEHDRDARRRATRAKRMRARVDRHFSGFDEMDMEAAAAQLAQDENDESDDEEAYDSGFSSSSEEHSGEGGDSDTGLSSYSRSSPREECNSPSSPSEAKGFRLLERAREARGRHDEGAGPQGPRSLSHKGVRRGALDGRENKSTVSEAKGPDFACLPPALQFRQEFAGFFFQRHLNLQHRYPCHHSLLCLRGPTTIQGPCGLIGFGLGEVSVGGYLLGKKQLVLWSRAQQAVLLPMKKIKTVHVHRRQRPVWATLPPLPQSEDTGDATAVLPSAVCRSLERAGRLPGSANVVAAEAMDTKPDVEAAFGTIDWEWVDATVRSWKALFADKIPPVVLVVQPFAMEKSGTRRYYLRKKKKGRPAARLVGRDGEVGEASASSRDAYVDIPNFVSRRNVANIDVALLSDVIPAVVRDLRGSVVVMGSQNIGKSTLCRFLTNALLSQHGLCYWLDLDLGQPEFAAPGHLSLYAVRQPLLRPHDVSSAELVRSYFIGSNTVSCPVTMGTAIACMCEMVTALQRHHPVVVNTHGWVLHTGRRTTVEAIRRLQPRHVVHLVKEREEAWAKDMSWLMDPTHGLNADVVPRRFLVRHVVPVKDGVVSQTRHDGQATNGAPVKSRRAKNSSRTTAGQQGPVYDVIGRLPHARSSGTEDTSAGWEGHVHTVRVTRDEDSHLRRHEEAPLKGSAGRQSRWQECLAPLIMHYGAADRETATADSPHDGKVMEDATETTLLRAPIGHLHRIVMAHMGSDVLTLAELAAALEHSVVAVQFHTCPPSDPDGDRKPIQRMPTVVDLSSLTFGFPLSCHGYIESTEAELRGEGDAGGYIAIRVPLPRSVVAEMLTASSDVACGAISIACSSALRNDTHFMEEYP